MCKPNYSLVVFVAKYSSEHALSNQPCNAKPSWLTRQLQFENCLLGMNTFTFMGEIHNRQYVLVCGVLFVETCNGIKMK